MPRIAAFFLQRYNRFVVQCRLATGELVKAHLPNPGRLWELLFPGVELRLAGGKTGQYAYGVLAVKKGNKWVYLHTIGNNDLAERLLRAQRVPGLESYSVVRREVSSKGHSSRFDFLLEKDGEPLWLEVKMCSLFQGRMAMFPDAPTLRGQRHLEELSALSDEGYRTGVLFIIQDLEADFFLPEYHTDPDFARILYDNRKKIDYFALGTAINEDLTWKDEVKPLSLPLAILPDKNRDSGLYLILMEMVSEVTICVGALGEQRFLPGWYVYVGSAKKSLDARVARHLRKRKKFHWHIDYLRQAAEKVKGIPIRTAGGGECLLASEITALGDGIGPKGFGSSDCGCPSHLTYFKDFPLDIQAFVEKLLYWRMERPLKGTEYDVSGKTG